MRYNITISIILLAVLSIGFAGCAPRDGIYLVSDGKFIKKGDARDKNLYGTFPENMSDEQRSALNSVNYYRAAANLPDAVMATELNDAALAHAEYVVTYSKVGLVSHNEDSEREGFTGEKPWDRADYYGFTEGNIAEVISFRESPTAAIDELMATVYHRLILLSPGETAMGYGRAVGSDFVYHYETETFYDETESFESDVIRYNNNSANVIKFARYDVYDLLDGSENPRAVLYPRPGQANVPREMAGEVPDPLPDYPSPYGYPITLSFYSLHRNIKYIDGKLYNGAGEEIEVQAITPENDVHGFLKKAMCILPKSPLAARSYFRAVFTVTIGGSEREIETYFTTR